MANTAECIAFVNHKGGTGKTTSCISIAGFFAKNGCKTLVVDFDPQANATSGLGIDGATLQYSMYDAILDQCEGYEGVPIAKVILETDVKIFTWRRLNLICLCQRLSCNGSKIGPAF